MESNKTNETIPVKYEFMGSLRRSAIDVPPRFNQLRKKLARSFPNFAEQFVNQELRLIYTDDEGDEITITTTDELIAAYRLAQAAGKVLRFSVPEFSESANAEATPETPVTKEETERKAEPVPVVLHYGITCDVSNQCPIRGPRFHKRGEDYDLCEGEFNKLDRTEQAKFIRLDKPTQIADSLPKQQEQQVVHFGVSCDATGQSPIVGPRFHKIGANYDLCKAAFEALPADEQKLYTRLDVPTRIHDWQSGSHGNGGNQHFRQHRRQVRQAMMQAMQSGREAHNRQLRQQAQRKAWQQRKQARQQSLEARKNTIPVFVRDVTVADDTVVRAGDAPIRKQWLLRAGPGGLPAGTSAVQVGKANGNKAPFAGTARFFPVNNNLAVEPDTEFSVTVELQLDPARAVPGRTCRSMWRLQDAQGRKFGPRFWAQVVVGQPQASASANADMSFVDDVTIPDGSVVEPRSQLRKTWHVRSESGWGHGNTLRCLDESGPYKGLSEKVPAVPAGAAADLSITLAAPEATDGTSAVRSYWGLVNANGKRFGDQLWVDFVPRAGAVGRLSEADVDAILEQAAPESISESDDSDTDSNGGEKEAEAKEDDASAAQPPIQLQPAEILQQVLKVVETLSGGQQAAMNNKLFQALATGDVSAVVKALAQSK